MEQQGMCRARLWQLLSIQLVQATAFRQGYLHSSGTGDIFGRMRHLHRLHQTLFMMPLHSAMKLLLLIVVVMDVTPLG
jgi:hypothetical protein